MQGDTNARNTTDISLERLCQEVSDSSTPPQHTRTEQLLSQVLEDLFQDTEFRFDEELVKASLDELLIALITIREGSTHGKGLMDDLAQSFGVTLSPGTVYPRLNELDEQGVLEKQELVRTKEYRISGDRGREFVERRMQQHLALGMFLGTALEEFDGN